jgi:hypothetical protein
MTNAITLRHRGFVGQPLAVVVPLDPILTIVDLSPTLSIKWCKLLLFAMLCLTPYLLLLCLLEVERWMLKSIMINLAMSVNTFFLTIFLIPIVSITHQAMNVNTFFLTIFLIPIVCVYTSS